MSRIRVVVQGAAYSGASVFLSMGALLIVGKIFTNALTLQEVAAFGAIMALADFLNIALGLGIYNGLPKLVAAAPADARPAYVRAALIGQAAIALIFGALFYLLLAVASGFIRAHAEDWTLLQQSWPVLRTVPVLFFVGALRETAMAALAGLNRYAARAASTGIASVAQVVLVVMALGIYDLGLPGLIYATIAAHTLAVLGMLLGLPMRANRHMTRAAWIAALRFSFPLYVNSLLTFFYTRFDFFIVSAFLGAGAAGIYDTIKRLPTILSRVLNALLVPYLPNVSELIAQDDHAGASRMLHHALALTAFLGYTATLCAVIVQEPLIRLLFSEAYVAGAPVLGLLLAAIALTVQAGILGQSLIALGHPHLITLINIGLACAGVLGNVLLLPAFGLMGAGYAALAAIVLSYLLQAVTAQHYGMTLRWKHLLRPHLFLGLSALPIVLGAGNWPYRLPALGLFVTLCLSFGVVTRQHLGAVFSALRPVRKNGPTS